LHQLISGIAADRADLVGLAGRSRAELEHDRRADIA
jgi:hypothetical protein